MNYLSSMLIVATFAVASCGTVPSTTIAKEKAGISAPSEIGAKSFLLKKVVTQIPLGEEVMNIQHGWGCFMGSSTHWRGGEINVTAAEFQDGFRKEFKKLNYKVAGDPSALFDDRTVSDAELLVAGAIEKLEINVCFPFSGSPTADFGITDKLKGSTFMRVRWQIYSKADEKVVMEATTEGSYSSQEVMTGSVPLFLKNAFQANVRNLLAEPKLFELSKPSMPERKAHET